MSKYVRVIGVHPVKAQPRFTSGEVEPVHLLEIEFQDTESFSFNDITQLIPSHTEFDRQAPWDEQCLESGSNNRYCFFFHFLDQDFPMHTSFGPVKLPKESPIPPHLKDIKYIEPS